jgi:hypothetical protein
MKLYYIASNDQQWLIEKAIQDAIEKTIVIPFKEMCHKTWINFVDCSFILCLSAALVGAIFGIAGIKKGHKVTVFCLIFYILLRMFSYVMGWY